MATVDPAQIQWLKDGAKTDLASDAGVTAAFGADATISDVSSPLALAADAATENARQLAFLKGPLVVDKHLVTGLKTYLIGRPITLTIARLGYDAGLDVFVIDAQPVDGVDLTYLSVLRRL